MKAEASVIQLVKIDRIFLDLENPRHEPFHSEEQVVEYLCRDELIYGLAKDIAHKGINPLEIFGLLLVRRGPSEHYTVLEGNRRMCAIKLLNDPELAPVKYRKEFERLGEAITIITEVPSVIFTDRSEVYTWLERIHGGLQGGAGRKQWNPEQKTRHIGDTKNLLAQTILDYAVKESLVSEERRKGKLTTVQRYLSNPIFREAIGIDNRNIDDISRTRPKSDFDILLKRFLNDLVDDDNKNVSSRSNKAEIEAYSRTIISEEETTGKRTESESLNSVTIPTKKRGLKYVSPEEPKHPNKVHYDSELHQKLKEIPSYKLDCMYYSLCMIELKNHTLFLCVGLWSFMECLTARTGRSNTDFFSYLNDDKLTRLGFDNKEDRKSLKEVLKRIHSYGNTTKHHESAANFNHQQLYNDMVVISKLLCRLAEEARKLSI